VTISPALRDVTLLSVFDAIMEVAAPPKTHPDAPRLRYVIEDYAIVIGQRRYEPEPLYTRTFKIDPNTLIQGLDQNFGTGVIQSPNALTPIQRALRNLMVRAGVDFGTNNGSGLPSINGAPQRAIYFNDRSGVLMARATLSELNLVEKALQKLNSANQYQILFTVEAVEVPELKTLNEFMRTVKLAGQISTRFTDPQYRELRRKTAANFKWISLPKVTTVSGRAARVQIESRFGVDLLAEYAAEDKPIKLKVASFDAGQAEPESKEALINDGQTVALMPFADDEKVQPQRIVFVTATLIDAAGNRVNLPDEETQNTLP
jgi:hypothetical protein